MPGVPIAAEGDPKARCVEKQNRMKEKIGGEGWSKVAACIMGKSDISAMEMAGRPSPTSPLTVPASRKIASPMTI